MNYTGYELLWLFAVYSAAGWWLEVGAAAVKRHRFVNRGYLNGPFCPVYGLSAAAFAVFLPELKEHLVFLFLGGMILAAFTEYICGFLLERIFRQKWWDYSEKRFCAGGYVALETSIFWGICAVLCIRVFNPFLIKLIHILPAGAGKLLLGIILGTALLDGLGSSAAVFQMHRRLRKMASQVSGDMQRLADSFGNALTRRIRRRMMGAYPGLKAERLIAGQRHEAAENEHSAEKTVFAAGCCSYKLTALFFIGAFLGDITETVFCYSRTGIIMSRSSVVYGPFSIVWGFGCVLLTAFLYPYREKNDRYIFLAGTILGGAYEYICSVFSELVFGTVFWDYSAIPFNLGGRINLLYCFFWGIVAVVWLKILYPFLSRAIERIPVKWGKFLCNGLILFMVFDMAVSGLALGRYSARQDKEVLQSQMGSQEASLQKAAGEEERAGTEMGREEGNTLAEGLNGWLDYHFPDERMKRIYPNAKFVD